MLDSIQKEWVAQKSSYGAGTAASANEGGGGGAEKERDWKGYQAKQWQFLQDFQSKQQGLTTFCSQSREALAQPIYIRF
jgi:hypothetical protein